MTTIKQLAAKYPKTTVKKLLSEFTRKFPEKNWTPDSEVPEGFTENFEQAAQDYAEASGLELPKGAITNLPDALKQNKDILDCFEYGIVEAIAALRTQELTNFAELQAIRDIQQTESAYNGVWERYFESKLDAAQKRLEVNNKAALDASLALNEDLGNRQAKLIRTQTMLTDSQKQSTASTANAISAIL